MQSHIDEVISQDTYQEIEIDFSNVQFLDSSGVGALVYLYTRQCIFGMSLKKISTQFKI